MRVPIGCVMLVAGLLVAVASAQEAKKGPYDRVATGKAHQKAPVKVYTNADLEKMFDIVAEEDREPAAPAPEGTAESEKAEPAKVPDPLTWLRHRQNAQRDHAKAVAEAQASVTAAKQQLAALERQLLAARNPFSARPNLSDEEKEERRKSGESAAQRYDRTRELVEKAREAVRAAESELARLRAARP